MLLLVLQWMDVETKPNRVGIHLEIKETAELAVITIKGKEETTRAERWKAKVRYR